VKVYITVLLDTMSTLECKWLFHTFGCCRSVNRSTLEFDDEAFGFDM
jgi:hypothetical protein